MLPSSPALTDKDRTWLGSVLSSDPAAKQEAATAIALRSRMYCEGLFIYRNRPTDGG